MDKKDSMKKEERKKVETPQTRRRADYYPTLVAMVSDVINFDPV
jgi:hypothetical protein